MADCADVGRKARLLLAFFIVFVIPTKTGICPGIAFSGFLIETFGNDNKRKGKSSMSNSTIALLLFIGVIIFLLAGIIYAIRQKNIYTSGSFASLAAFHDMQGRDKQNAIETVIEQQAEKKWKEEESGEGKTDNEVPSN